MSNSVAYMRWFCLLLCIHVKSQRICVSNQRTSGLINGNYDRINDYNNFSAYRQIMNSNENGYGCSTNTVYIYRLFNQYAIGGTLGGNSVYAFCGSETNNPTDCPSWSINQMIVSANECPTFNCDSISIENNAQANIPCSGRLTYQAPNHYAFGAYKFMWNKNFQQWMCLDRNDVNSQPGCSVSGIWGQQNNDGWTSGLTVANTINIPWLRIQTYTITIQCFAPTVSPTRAPTNTPTKKPSNTPTRKPTDNPTKIPTLSPTIFPTLNPSVNPTYTPTKMPSNSPSKTPTKNPTQIPTLNPTIFPTTNPSMNPTEIPNSSILSGNNNNNNGNTAQILIFVGIGLFFCIVIVCICVFAHLFSRNKESPELKTEMTNNSTKHTLGSATMDEDSSVSDQEEGNPYESTHTRNDIVSEVDIQIQNDKIIASEWQKDMFDFKHITSGMLPANQIITKSNDQRNDNEIQINNDALIAMNVSKNQNEINEFTNGNMDKKNWFTQN